MHTLFARGVGGGDGEEKVGQEGGGGREGVTIPHQMLYLTSTNINVLISDVNIIYT